MTDVLVTKASHTYVEFLCVYCVCNRASDSCSNMFIHDCTNVHTYVEFLLCIVCVIVHQTLVVICSYMIALMYTHTWNSYVYIVCVIVHQTLVVICSYMIALMYTRNSCVYCVCNRALDTYS